jgi:hypothetical protein
MPPAGPAPWTSTWRPSECWSRATWQWRTTIWKRLATTGKAFRQALCQRAQPERRTGQAPPSGTGTADGVPPAHLRCRGRCRTSPARHLKAYLADNDEYRAIAGNLLHIGSRIAFVCRRVTVTLGGQSSRRVARALGQLLDKLAAGYLDSGARPPVVR